MSMDSATGTDDRGYGEVLGEYFEVAAAIGRRLDEFGRPRETDRDRYEELCDRRSKLRDRLAEMECDEGRSEIKELLDRAFASE